MSVLFFNQLLGRVRPQRKSSNHRGFTLTELLVSIIIGGLIVTGLMSLVVELMSTETRETARTETQREMQMALDFISTDIREAVYVYDGSCSADEDVDGTGTAVSDNCAGIFNYIPAPNDASVPILAFWKLEALPQAVRNNCSATYEIGGSLVPCISGRMYTLVVYYLSRSNPNNLWQGKARILRYTLPRYSSSGAPVSGYADPTNNTNFASWPLDAEGNNQQDGAPPNNRAVVLVDFVDDRALSDIPELVDAGGASVECPAENTADARVRYVRTPSDSTLERFGFADVRNFYACVKLPEQFTVDSSSDDDAGSAFNQKVILFLRGNAAGKPGITTANEGFMPAIQTQVLNRGVREKKPPTD
ncbi:MAG: prepilin-type N-terminal cleavage/methylation domain-containing protein [Cyanobacteria bacterium SID2]|nr:prepilin-type N-terminal cleavage/methylation domain-containing protein [Cyanobacteria bacterium SID2]MBP0005511.1 prepilin-type N-terminal cleavage/methylation domain-containing protein [Cyanobacteria bacterium SBC]